MFLSIQGIYEYDNTVFDGFDSPSYTDENNVVHTLNRDDVINNILLQCAELELVYPSPQMMKFAIGVWSASNARTWDKLYKSMFLEYNPIWNVDATETETETNERDISRLHSGTNNETVNLTDAETVNLTDTESVQGFNTATWSEAKKNVKSGTDNITHTGTDNTSISNNETVNDDNERILSKRRTGNIGVTSSQSLVQAEREVADFSIIEFITQSFKERFCLLIY